MGKLVFMHSAVQRWPLCLGQPSNMIKRGWPEAGMAKWESLRWLGTAVLRLARTIPKIIRRHKPDLFVVSLGTNDYQAVRLHNRAWLRPGTSRWKKVYASRVRKMLDLMVVPATATCHLGRTDLFSR